MKAEADFSSRLVAWQRQDGRHDLPWQNTRDPYRIWLSEIMLQQTQVSAVIPYYQRFLRSFPTIAALAAASEDQVLTLWSGLGYYARARNLHRAARLVTDELNGCFPHDFESLCALPGIGHSTAAAICVFAFGARHAILDVNVKRVLARHEGVEGWPGERKVEALLWQRARALLPHEGVEAYTQGLMDLGASVCVRRQPRCAACPLKQTCVAFRDERVGELPAPRQTRPLPHRHTHWLVLRRQDEVLLEKRPGVGIWGGLWSFPEVESSQLPAVCLRYGVDAANLQTLGAIEHGFTHFHLTIQPLTAHISAPAQRAAEPGQLWLSVEDALGAAIPTPVRELLRRLKLPSHTPAAAI